MKYEFDVIVIGTSQAGPFLAVRMANAGQRVAIVERGRFGGTCVNTGCIPTKTLVASAYAVHMTRRAAEFGFEVTGPVRVDMKRVKARKDEITEKSRSGLESWLKNTPNCTVYHAHARFESPNKFQSGRNYLLHHRFSSTWEGARGHTVHARSREHAVSGESQGFMKVLVDADSKEILGATILGTGGDEAIHCVLDMMYARALYTVMQRAMHIHPTASELIPTILGELRPL
jgi:pyruvate/2-oxoglutarate dehydrogenase complex dihydrolipoamide dehydrogenase (E3) component